MENENKLIAEFMDLSIKAGVCYYTDADDMFPMGIEVEAPYLPYDDDWNWLHVVLDKIEDECILRQRMADNLQSSGHLWFTSGYLYQCGTITEVCNAVVEFIKFYNQNK